jgi:hypothetical protein
MSDDSGIKSLAGFAYQIRVFAYYLSLMEQDMEVGFETLEDVAIKNLKENNIDEKCDNYCSIYKSHDETTAIQVKKTRLSNAKFLNVLFNWLLLEMSDKNISKYILFVDSSYNNEDNLFLKSVDELFAFIENSDKLPTALISKVKSTINSDFSKLETAYNSIHSKYQIRPIDNIDDELYNSYRVIFKKSGVLENIYFTRLNELLSSITSRIMDSVMKGKSFSCNHLNFMKLAEEICQNNTNDKLSLNYSNFRNTHSINITDLEISKSRQYKQLLACTDTPRFIEEHLMFEQYYNDFKCRCLENSKIDNIENIEITTCTNFSDVKEFLIQTNEDKPIKRLDSTKQRSNSYSDNEQIRFGSAIHLTKEKTEKSKLISWKDI